MVKKTQENKLWLVSISYADRMLDGTIDLKHQKTRAGLLCAQGYYDALGMAMFRATTWSGSPVVLAVSAEAFPSNFTVEKYLKDNNHTW